MQSILEDLHRQSDDCHVPNACCATPLQVSILEDKVLQQTTRIEALQAEHEETKTALTKQQSDQNDIVSYLKKEIEKRDAENKVPAPALASGLSLRPQASGLSHSLGLGGLHNC